LFFLFFSQQQPDDSRDSIISRQAEGEKGNSVLDFSRVTVSPGLKIQLFLLLFFFKLGFMPVLVC
jgi:hypothetical protein